MNKVIAALNLVDKLIDAAYSEVSGCCEFDNDRGLTERSLKNASHTIRNIKSFILNKTVTIPLSPDSHEVISVTGWSE